VAALEKLIRKETILVSVMAVNNEIGSIQPIQEISAVLENYPKIHFHVDAVQAITKVEQNQWFTPRIDFATFSAHKFHGPRGVGFIYWREGRKLAPLMNGGGQESNHRSGTENVPAIVAMARALRLAFEKKVEKPEHVARLKGYLLEALHSYEKVTIFSKEIDFAPHIICFSLKDIRGEVLVHALEEKQIYTSTTSACSSKKHLASSTLHAMNVPSSLATSAIRISLDESNTMAEVEQFLIVFNQLYQKFSKIN
jgi:cysteine desulfurase